MRNNDTTAGWKLVPVEPTPEMVHALADNVDLIDYEGGSRAGYAAMLAAAPQPPAAPQPAIADHACAPTELVAHESPNVSGKPAGGSPDHLLQDQSRGLSQWLASQPDARLHAREAAAEIAATQPVAQGGELPEVALTPPQDDIALQRFIHEFIHGNEPADADGARSSRGGLAEVIKEAAAPAGVAGEPVAWMDPENQRDPIGAEKKRDLETINGAPGRALAAKYTVRLYTAPPARQALTDEQIVSFANEAFDTTIDLDDETLVNKYGHGIYITRYLDFARAIERAHGIGGKGDADHG